MYRPTVDTAENSAEMISTFLGYNHNLIQNIGEFWDMENISFDNYPVLSPRNPASKYTLNNGFSNTAEELDMIIFNNKIAYFNGSALVYGDTSYELSEEQLNRGRGKHISLISFGTNIILFPHNVYIDTASFVPEILELGVNKKLLDKMCIVKNCSADGKTVYERIALGESSNAPIGQHIGGFVGSYTNFSIPNSSSFCVFEMQKDGGLQVYANYAGELNNVKIHHLMATYEKIDIFKYSENPDYSKNEYTDGDILIDASMQIGVGWQGYRTNKFYLSKNKGELFPLDDIVINDYENVYAYWIDTTDNNEIFKMYSNSSDTWVALTSGYSIISGISKNSGLKKGDSIKILQNGVNLIKHNDDETQFYYIYNYVEGEESDSIVIRHIAYDLKNDKTTSVLQSDTDFIKEIPQFDYVVSAGNRVWGCRYGYDENHKLVNQIYASAQGDATNWNTYIATDADSFSATLSFEGEFSGAAAMNGYPYFFKENAIFGIYGAYPSAYQLYTYEYQGCELQSHKSIAVVEGNIFFKSPNGICVFDGSNCVNISANLGNIEYHNAVGGGAIGKYFVSMLDENNQPATFIFDINKQMWLKLDNIKYQCIVSTNSGVILAINKDGGIISFGRNADYICGVGENEKYVKWFAKTGAIDYAYPNSKKVSNIMVRVLAQVDSYLEVYINYDSSDVWEQVCVINGTGIPQTVTANIIPQSCDHYALKFVGKGRANVISISNSLRQERGTSI